jgi:hypothetical protein
MNRKGELDLIFKPKMKLMKILSALKNDSLAFYLEKFN